jgi:hypothetical protein
MPVLPTAPMPEKRTKLAAVPKLGVCAKVISGEYNRQTPTKIVSTNLLFMVIGFTNIFFPECYGRRGTFYIMITTKQTAYSIR